MRLVAVGNLIVANLLKTDKTRPNSDMANLKKKWYVG